MKCLACDNFLSDREASRKYENWASLPEGEARYITLCDRCIVDTDLTYYENPSASNEEQNEDEFDSGDTDIREG